MKMDFFKFFKFRRYNQPQATEAPENVVPASESVMDEIQPQTEAPENVVPASESVMDEIQPQTEATTISESKFNSTIEIAQLENEFRVTLIGLTSPTGNNPSQSSTSSYSITDSVPSYEDYHFVKLNRVIKDDLRSIAQRMKSAGNLEKGVEVYQSVRKTFLDTSLPKLGVKKLSMSDIRSLEWGAFEGTIRQWIQGAKIWVSVLFVSEKRLCKHVFGGLVNGIDDNCFAGTVKDAAFQLFETGKALSVCASDRSRHPDKLFRILELHEMLVQLLDDLDVIFKSKSLESVGIVATEMQSRLAKAAREALLQFENDMLHEQSHFQDQKGGIDRVTTYVSKYLTQIGFYNEGLTKLIVSKPNYRSNICGDHITIPEVKLDQLDACTSTPLVVHLIWIIEILQFKLESKCKCHADASLTQLFMMNNVHYILETILWDQDLGKMVGEDYLKTLIENVQLRMNAYMGLTWDRVLYCLRDEGLYVSRGASLKVSKTTLKERFKIFNATLEEVHQNQAKWVIRSYIRSELCHSISEKLIGAYSSFFERFKSHLGNQNQQEKYIKYTVEDLKIRLRTFRECATKQAMSA